MITQTYNDDYSACEETFSTLRLYHDSISPSEVTNRLGLQPSKCFVKGDARGKRGKVYETNGWFLSSEDVVKSHDSRRHIDWIIDQIWDKREQVSLMIQEGSKIDISSYWVSSSGNGGPTLSPYQMARLGELGVEVWWDVYFSYDDLTD